jgi:MFS family permease
MLATLRQRNFALLWIATLISLIGDRALMTAMPFYVYLQTGSTLAMAGMFGAFYLPGFLFGSVAGVFVDRWDRKRILVVTNLIQTAVMLSLLLVHDGSWLWLVYAVTFIQEGLGMFTMPAEGALLPNLVTEEHLVSANALVGLNNTIARIVGPMLGGILLAAGDLSSVVWIDSASFLLAALLVLGIAAPSQVATVSAEVAGTVLSAWRAVGWEWREGIQVVRRSRLLVTMFLVMNITSLGGTLIDPLFVPFVQDQLHAGAEARGLLSTVGAIGGLFGGLIIGWIGNRIPRRYVIGGGAVIVGLFMVAIYNQTDLTIAAVLTFIMTIIVIAFSVASQTLLQTATTDQYRGRVYGALGTTNALIGLVSVGIAGALGNVLGVVPLLNLAGGITIFAGLLALMLLPKHETHEITASDLEESLAAGG